MQTAERGVADQVFTVLLIVGLGNVVTILDQLLLIGRVIADPQPGSLQLPGGGGERQVAGQRGLAIHVVDVLLHDVVEGVLAHQQLEAYRLAFLRRRHLAAHLQDQPIHLLRGIEVVKGSVEVHAQFLCLCNHLDRYALALGIRQGLSAIAQVDLIRRLHGLPDPIRALRGDVLVQAGKPVPGERVAALHEGCAGLVEVASKLQELGAVERGGVLGMGQSGQCTQDSYR